MKSTFRIFLILLISISLLNCASFSAKNFKNDYTSINPGNLHSFDGKFSFSPIKKFDKKTEHSNIENLKKYINSYNFITNESIKFNDIDSILNGTINYQIELKIITDKELSVELFKNNQSIKKQQIKGELKKDGMFYLDNKFLKCTGIPYLFGGCQNNKRRIAISKNNNLIVNEALDNTGALLFLFWAGPSYNSTYEFQRVE
jgi:hypothetical protein